MKKKNGKCQRGGIKGVPLPLIGWQWCHQSIMLCTTLYIADLGVPLLWFADNDVTSPQCFAPSFTLRLGSTSLSLSICLSIDYWFALREGDWEAKNTVKITITVSTKIHSDFFPLIRYWWSHQPMILWESLPIVRPQTQVTQSSR